MVNSVVCCRQINKHITCDFILLKTILNGLDSAICPHGHCMTSQIILLWDNHQQDELNRAGFDRLMDDTEALMVFVLVPFLFNICPIMINLFNQTQAAPFFFYNGLCIIAQRSTFEAVLPLECTRPAHPLGIPSTTSEPTIEKHKFVRFT